MTTLSITSPEGKTFRVQVPEGMDPDTAVEQFGKDMGWSPQARTVAPAGAPARNDFSDTARIAGTAAAQGATDTADLVYGLGPNLSETGRGIANWILRQTGLRPDAGRRPGEKPAANVSPSNIASTLGVPLDPQAEAKRIGAEWTPTRAAIASGARAAAGMPLLGAGLGMTALTGAGAGLGHAVGGETGALIGSIATPLAGAMIPGLLRSTSQTIGNATRPMRPQGRQDIAERIVRESATDPAAASAALAANRPPLPNAGFTAAEMSGDRGLLGLQRAYMGRPGTVTGGDYAGANIPDAFISARSNQGAALNRLIGRMGPYQSTDDASVGLANTMRRGAFEPVLRDERAAWNSFRTASGNQTFDADPLHSAWNALRRQSNIRPDRDLVPAREYNKLRNIFERGATDLDEIQSIRSGLLDASRKAAQAGERNQARVIDAHRRVLDDYINNLPVRDPATLGLYQNARTMTRAKNTVFTDSNVGRAFERTGQQYDLEATRVAKEAFKTREAFDDTMRIARANPAVLTEMRRNFVTKFMESARTTAVDLPTGERVLSRAALDRFLADPIMQHARGQLYNTPATRRIWNRIEDALTRMDATNRAKPNVGSNTSHDLQRGSVLDGLLMRFAGKLTGGVTTTIANRFTDILYKTSLQEIDGLVANILLNPAAARAALARPTPGNFRLLQHITNRAPRPIVVPALENAGQSRQ